MKNFFPTFLLLILQGVSVYGQKETISLMSPRYLHTQNGLIVCATDNGGTILRVFQYDSNLKKIKEYSKDLKSLGKKFGLMYVLDAAENTLIGLGGGGNSANYYLQLDKNLQEVSFELGSDEERRVYDEERKEKGTAFYNRPRYFAFDGEIPDQNFIGKDWMQIRCKSNGAAHIYALGDGAGQLPEFNNSRKLESPVANSSIRRFKPVPSKFDDTYALAWQTDIPEKEIETAEFIYMDKHIVIAFITSSENKKIVEGALYILNAVDGKLIQRTSVQPDEAATQFYFTKGYYDLENKTIVVAGNAINKNNYKDEYHVEVKNYLLFTFDRLGKQLSEKQYTLPDLSSFDYRQIDFEHPFPMIAFISKNKENDYVFQSEILGRRKFEGGEKLVYTWVPVGLDAFKLNSSGNLTAIGKYLYPIDEITPSGASNCFFKHSGSTSDGTKALVSIVYKAEHYVKLISLSGNSAETILTSFKSNAHTDDDCLQFLMSDDKVLVVKRVGKELYEFEIITF